jgi:DNA-binding transcriptional LysR family regulator
VELRDIEIFLTLAEELHFGRTAARLHVSQARVSQAIKQQERGIGAPLFERTSRVVRLTAVGEQLRNDLRPIYQGLGQSMERARLAAQGKTDVLRVGIAASNAYDLRSYFQAFRTAHPHWGLQVSQSPFNDAFGQLRRSDIDLLVSWLPVEEPDFTVGPVICTEPRVLAVSHDHPYVERGAVPVEILGDFSVSGPATALPQYWEDSVIPFSTPQGRTIHRGAVADSLDEIFTNVGLGEAVQLLAAHNARYHARPDIVYLPVTDAERIRWALVWRTETAAVRALAEVVRDLGPREL